MEKKSENEIIRMANAAARRAGHGSATEINFAEIKTPQVISHTCYGYRKNTTGEYVPNKYRSNFGWKNTYYQHAETVVLMPIGLVDWQS